MEGGGVGVVDEGGVAGGGEEDAVLGVVGLLFCAVFREKKEEMGQVVEG